MRTPSDVYSRALLLTSTRAQKPPSTASVLQRRQRSTAISPTSLKARRSHLRSDGIDRDATAESEAPTTLPPLTSPLMTSATQKPLPCTVIVFTELDSNGDTITALLDRWRSHPCTANRPRPLPNR